MTQTMKDTVIWQTEESDLIMLQLAGCAKVSKGSAQLAHLQHTPALSLATGSNPESDRGMSAFSTHVIIYSSLQTLL